MFCNFVDFLGKHAPRPPPTFVFTSYFNAYQHCPHVHCRVLALYVEWNQSHMSVWVTAAKYCSRVPYMYTYVYIKLVILLYPKMVSFLFSKRSEVVAQDVINLRCCACPNRDARKARKRALTSKSSSEWHTHTNASFDPSPWAIMPHLGLSSSVLRSCVQYIQYTITPRGRGGAVSGGCL